MINASEAPLSASFQALCASRLPSRKTHGLRTRACENRVTFREGLVFLKRTRIWGLRRSPLLAQLSGASRSRFPAQGSSREPGCCGLSDPWTHLRVDPCTRDASGGKENGSFLMNGAREMSEKFQEKRKEGPDPLSTEHLCQMRGGGCPGLASAELAPWLSCQSRDTPWEVAVAPGNPLQLPSGKAHSPRRFTQSLSSGKRAGRGPAGPAMAQTQCPSVTEIRQQRNRAKLKKGQRGQKEQLLVPTPSRGRGPQSPSTIKGREEQCRGLRRREGRKPVHCKIHPTSWH